MRKRRSGGGGGGGGAGGGCKPGAEDVKTLMRRQR